MSLKECSQCMANTKEGRRCKNRTCKSGLCWIHLKRDKGLRIKPSSVQGLGQGLFVTKRFQKNERITKYTGERLSRAAIDRRYPGDIVAQYTLCSGNSPTSQCIDARKTNSGAGRYANTARGTGQRNNAKFTRNFNIKATRNIQPNSEVFVGYGREFRFV
eukprot:SAG31_NODE_1972_length_6762_cov_16.244635_3_plen_160_part_00